MGGRVIEKCGLIGSTCKEFTKSPQASLAGQTLLFRSAECIASLNAQPGDMYNISSAAEKEGLASKTTPQSI